AIECTAIRAIECTAIERRGGRARGRSQMPWVVREAGRDVNRAVARRWHAIAPLLPDPSALPAGCGEPLVVNGDNGRIAGLGVCVHQHVPPQSLNQTWGAAERFTLVPPLPGQDIAASASQP